MEDEHSDKNIIHIAINIDNKYGYPSIVFLTSLLENKKPETFYDVHVLTSPNINQKYTTKLSTLVDKYGKDNLRISFIDMKNAFKGAITGSHISTAAYYRIALPSLLPDVDRIIYSDTDVINFADLTEMYNLELKDKIYFKGILDQVGLLHELKNLGIYTQKYMNSGILLMNLKSMRKYGIENKIRDYIRNHYLDHHDQTAINAVCYNDFEILSVKYATFNYNSYESIVQFNNQQDKRYRYSEDELKQAYYEPTLLHFAGWVKPWDHGYSKASGEYWWYYASKSDFFQEITDNYGFKKSDVESLLNKIPSDGGLLKRNYKK